MMTVKISTLVIALDLTINLNKKTSKFAPVVKTIGSGCEVLRAIVNQGSVIFGYIEQSEV